MRIDRDRDRDRQWRMKKIEREGNLSGIRLERSDQAEAQN